jgi:hypothetical protein
MTTVRKSTDILALGRKANDTDWDNNFQVLIDLLTAVGLKVDSSKIGENNGVASLNNLGKVVQTALDSDKINGKTFTELASYFVASTLLGLANGVATLGSDGKLSTTQIPASTTSGLTPKGAWNATTNSPSIPSASSGNNGWFYIVNVAGNTNINGINTWTLGDWIVSNGTAWERIPFSVAIANVAGLQSALDGKLGSTSQAADSAKINGYNYSQLLTIVSDLIAEAVVNKVDKDAEANDLPDLDLFNIDRAGTYFIPDLSVVENSPLPGFSGVGFLECKKRDETTLLILNCSNNEIYQTFKLAGDFSDWHLM